MFHSQADILKSLRTGWEAVNGCGMWHVAQAGFPYAAMLMGITGAGYLITAKKADGVSGASPLEEL